MDNACAGVVAQDQGPAGRWDLSREKVRGVSCDAAAQVTAQDAANGPVWEIGTISFVPYAMVPIFFFFFEQTLSPLFGNTTQPKNKPDLPSKKSCKAAFNN